MALINNEITAQKFEEIRNRIAFILADEFDNQFSITGNDIFKATQWIERFIPFDKTELPAVNVYFDTADFSDKNPATSKGEYVFNIEVIVSGKDTDTDGGDKLASFKLQKIIGVIRYILENPNYLNLNFDEKFIFNTNVSSMQVGNNNPNQDGTHTVSGQLRFIVTAEESNGVLTPVTGEKYTTKMKINETEKGFFIEI